MAAHAGPCGFDLRSLTMMIADARDDDPGPVLPWSLLDALNRLIPVEETSICELDIVNRHRVIQQSVVHDDPRNLVHGDPDAWENTLFWRHYGSFWAGELPSPAGQVRCWSDRYPGDRLAEQPLYRELFRPNGMRHFLGVGLPAPAGHERNLLFWRNTDPDFTDRDKDLLALLRPHIAEIHADAVRRRRGVLTAREWQVLELAAQGYGNSQIAALLFTSVGTVRKHLEHIFDKTGARTRGAAVARLLPELSRSPVATTSGRIVSTRNLRADAEDR